MHPAWRKLSSHIWSIHIIAHTYFFLYIPGLSICIRYSSLGKAVWQLSMTSYEPFFLLSFSVVTIIVVLAETLIRPVVRVINCCRLCIITVRIKLPRIRTDSCGSVIESITHGKSSPTTLRSRFGDGKVRFVLRMVDFPSVEHRFSNRQNHNNKFRCFHPNPIINNATHFDVSITIIPSHNQTQGVVIAVGRGEWWREGDGGCSSLRLGGNVPSLRFGHWLAESSVMILVIYLQSSS